MRSTRLRIFLILSTLLVLLCSNALGVSIMPAKVNFNFEPNQEVQVGFNICGASSIRSYLEGDLKEYATIIDENQDGDCRDIVVRINFPANIEKPGNHRLLVGALELIGANRGGVAGRAAIQAPIDIFVPYPGLYAEMRFVAPNVNEGEIVPFSVFVNNLGTDDIQSASAVIDVYDDYSKIKSLNTNTESIPSKKSTELYVDMTTTNIKAGSYKASATLNYDNQILTNEKTFNIGTLYLAINNYTTLLGHNIINKFEIDIESKWNNKLEDVYAEVEIGDEKVKTPNTEVNPWQKKKITAYFDTTGMALGEYNTTITLHYEGKTTTEKTKVFILEGLEGQAVAVKEEPFRINIEITPTTILIAIIVLLIVVDIVWLVIRRRRKQGNEA